MLGKDFSDREHFLQRKAQSMVKENHFKSLHTKHSCTWCAAAGILQPAVAHAGRKVIAKGLQKTENDMDKTGGQLTDAAYRGKTPQHVKTR